jgi:hypothetical protein
MILRLVACSDNAESVSGSAKSEGLAVSLESREKLFREGLEPQMNASARATSFADATTHRDFTKNFVETRTSLLLSTNRI